MFIEETQLVAKTVRHLFDQKTEHNYALSRGFDIFGTGEISKPLTLFNNGYVQF